MVQLWPFPRVLNQKNAHGKWSLSSPLKFTKMPLFFFIFFNKFEDQTRCQIDVNLKLTMLKGFRINKLLDSLIHFKGI